MFKYFHLKDHNAIYLQIKTTSFFTGQRHTDCREIIETSKALSQVKVRKIEALKNCTDYVQ